MIKHPPAMQETQEKRVLPPGQEDPLEEEMAAHSSNLARKIPWTEGPNGLQYEGSQRVRHYRVTEHTFLGPSTVPGSGCSILLSA